MALLDHPLLVGAEDVCRQRVWVLGPRRPLRPAISGGQAPRGRVPRGVWAADRHVLGGVRLPVRWVCAHPQLRHLYRRHALPPPRDAAPDGCRQQEEDLPPHQGAHGDAEGQHARRRPGGKRVHEGNEQPHVGLHPPARRLDRPPERQVHCKDPRPQVQGAALLQAPRHRQGAPRRHHGRLPPRHHDCPDGVLRSGQDDADGRDCRAQDHGQDRGGDPGQWAPAGPRLLRARERVRGADRHPRPHGDRHRGPALQRLPPPAVGHAPAREGPRD
mmetsp:Transcript_27975/g.65207  ORF Transcript_27975/g.65207 Transcript_27975/m.65207 type:complete len:273 (-) Transcript_27975:281-1099(-)